MNDQFASFGARQVQNIVHDIEQAPGCPLDGAYEGLLGIAERGIAQQFNIAEDRIHRYAHFMRNIGQQPGFGFWVTSGRCWRFWPWLRSRAGDWCFFVHGRDMLRIVLAGVKAIDAGRMPRMDTSANKPPAKRLRRGDQVTVDIESLTQEGRGVARHNGKVMFVADALPGETVMATVVKTQRRHDLAATDAIQVASPQRVVPRCEWFGACGGCSLQHLGSTAQLSVKQGWLLDALERIGGLTPDSVLPPLAGPSWGYRRKARLGVKYVDRKERVLVGFRERYKPYITDMAGCEVLDVRLARLIEPLQQLISGLSICKRLPQIELAAGDSNVVLVMRVLDEPTAADIEAMAGFGRDHDVLLCLQPAGLDSITALGGGPVPVLTQTLPEFDVTMEFHATDFLQINAEINRAMISKVVEYLQPAKDDTVLDLFCGLGNFSLPLARRAGRVVGVEGAASLVSRARGNAQINRLENVEFHTANLDDETAATALLKQDCDLMLLDPPRTGAAVICAMAPQLTARRIAYVSCHPATLARDAGVLTQNGRYSLRTAGVMDMFPHTAHVESIAIFERNS